MTYDQLPTVDGNTFTFDIANLSFGDVLNLIDRPEILLESSTSAYLAAGYTPAAAQQNARQMTQIALETAVGMFFKTIGEQQPPKHIHTAPASLN